MPSTPAQRVAYAALGAALVAVATMFVQIPMPAGQGYANVGEAAIFALAALFGPMVGLAAGGIGSALADVLTGYAVWAPFTLVIKGIEGWIAGRLAYEAFRARGVTAQVLLGFALASLWMMAGYFLAGAALAGSFAAAAAGIPLNLFQAAAGMAAGTALLYGL
ncbi:MAG: ECF transporter S component, partial [Limnochordales bacterium]